MTPYFKIGLIVSLGTITTITATGLLLGNKKVRREKSSLEKLNENIKNFKEKRNQEPKASKPPAKEIQKKEKLQKPNNDDIVSTDINFPNIGSAGSKLQDSFRSR